jgi:hypothetical protein
MYVVSGTVLQLIYLSFKQRKFISTVLFFMGRGMAWEGQFKDNPVAGGIKT